MILMIGIDYVISFLPLLVLPFALLLSVRLCRITLSRGVAFLLIGWAATLFSAAPIICILAFVETYLEVETLPWVFDIDTLPEWHKLVRFHSPVDISIALWSLIFLVFSSSILGSFLASRVIGLQWKRGMRLTFLFGFLLLGSVSILGLTIRLLIWRH